MDHQSLRYYAERDTECLNLNIPSIVTVLLDILNYKSHLETTKYIANWLYSLSFRKDGMLSIYQSNGIPVLIKLLSDPEESVSLYAVKTLLNLLLNQEGSIAAVCEVDGLQKMVMLLKHNCETFLSFLIDCLNTLVYRNQRNKLIIFLNNGPAELLRIMETYNCKILLLSISKILKTLSNCSINQHAIIAFGGVQVLAKHLNNSSQEFVINCLLILRSVSHAASKQENVTSLLKRLVQLLRSRDKNIVNYAVAILYNMTCGNAHNKVIICQEKGIIALMNIILESQNEKIKESVICILRHMTNRHSEAETAQNAVILHSGLQTIVKFLHPDSSWSLKIAVIGLVRNLVQISNSHGTLLSLGTFHFLREMLHSVYSDISRNRDGLPFYEAHPTVIEGVEMGYIIEGILIIFLNLARNINISALLKDHDIMKTLIQILHKENGRIQSIVANLFCQIA